MARVLPAVRALVLSAAVAAGAAGCTLPLGGASPEPAPTVTVVAEPAPAPTVTATPEPPAPVLLTDQGIGPVTLTPPDPESYDRLVALLGAPTSPLEVYCELAPNQWARWGGLDVYFAEDGSLTGWSLGGGPLDDRIRPPFDIYPAEPLGRAIEIGGTPELREEGPRDGDYVTAVGGYAWISETDGQFAPIWYVDMNGPACE